MVQDPCLIDNQRKNDIHSRTHDQGEDKMTGDTQFTQIPNTGRGFETLCEQQSGRIFAIAAGDHIVRCGDIVKSNGKNPDVPRGVLGAVTCIKDPNSNTRQLDVWFNLNPTICFQNAFSKESSQGVYRAHMRFDELDLSDPTFQRNREFL